MNPRSRENEARRPAPAGGRVPSIRIAPVQGALFVLSSLLASGVPGHAQLTASGVSAAGASGMSPQPLTAPYDALTNTCVEVVNFFPEPLSGIAFDADGQVWAVNPHGSRVVMYADDTPAPELAFDTGLNPVSLAVWDPGPSVEQRRVLVVCVGTHALFVHRASDGSVEDVVRLESEPQDLVVDAETNRAFVSCAGTNRVLEIDLFARTTVASYDLPVGERSGPLSLDPGDPADPQDSVLYVAQTVTGNNSIAFGGGPGSSVGIVLDLEGEVCQLPDQDVYRIAPSTGTVTPLVRNAGSLVFDIEWNEQTDDLWILSTDSINKDPSLDTEPKLLGRFAINQLVLVPDVGDLTDLTDAPAGIDLDDHDPNATGAQYDPFLSIGQARAVDITSPAAQAPGWAVVASPTNDVILAVDPDGRRVLEFVLPDGAQCYDVEILPANENVFGALCLGTRTLEFFTIVPFSATSFASLPLGFDPTPQQVARGRDVFLDGMRSAQGRFTCATCHPGGRADQLAWPLRGDPCDVKDIMVTQSLLSIADTFPFHWRGERDLFDFQKGFAGLLGAPEDEVPDTAEMEDFVVFVESLQAPANPRQNVRRRLDDALAKDPAENGLIGSPIRGQEWFQTVDNFNGQTCAGCHTLESGSDGNQFIEFGSPAPRAASIEVAHLRQLQHKSEDTVSIDCGAFTRTVNENGFGVTHNGSVPNLFDFIVNTPAFFDLSEDQRTDVFRFVEQFDQGIAPSCHWASWFDAGSPARVRQEIGSILIAGARAGWNDVVAFGSFDDGSGVRPLRWAYDAQADLFEPDDPSVAALSWSAFADATRLGLAENVVLGVPPCNGRRFGIDQDNDGVVNGQELADGTDPFVADPPAPDTTAPQLVDARLEFATARMAKYVVEADEEVTYVVDYGILGGTQYRFEREDFVRRDTFVLTHAEPSTPTFPLVTHEVRITLTDRFGNVGGPFSVPAFQPEETGVMFPVFGLFTQVRELAWQKQDRVAGTLDAEVRIELDLNYGAPAFEPGVDLMVFGIVAVEDLATGHFEQSTSFTSSLPSTFDVVDGMGVVAPYVAEPGAPWIVSPLTEAVDPATLGETVIDFQQPGLLPGQRVKFVVMGVANLGEDPNDPSAVVYDAASLFQFQQLPLEDAAVLELAY